MEVTRERPELDPRALADEGDMVWSWLWLFLDSVADPAPDPERFRSSDADAVWLTPTGRGGGGIKLDGAIGAADGLLACPLEVVRPVAVAVVGPGPGPEAGGKAGKAIFIVGWRRAVGGYGKGNKEFGEEVVPEVERSRVVVLVNGGDAPVPAPAPVAAPVTVLVVGQSQDG